MKKKRQIYFPFRGLCHACYKNGTEKKCFILYNGLCKDCFISKYPLDW